jgi:hypothetical protein
MTDQPSATGQKLSRQEISDRVTGLGWRYNLGLIRTSIKVGSIAQAADVAQAVTALAAQDGDSLSADLRPDPAGSPAARPASRPRAHPAGLDQRARRRSRQGTGTARDQPGVGTPAGRADRRPGQAQGPPGQAPYTPQTRRVWHAVVDEAMAHGDDYIGTEHFLLGLFRSAS